MRVSAVSIILVCLGAAAILYFIYYFVIPIIVSGWYLNHTYAASKYECGFFWVKLNKDDPDYWVYKIEMNGVKIRDACWVMYFKHKEAYQMYMAGREADERKND